MSWFAKKEGKHYYCTVSGGYVMYGSWGEGDPRTSMTNGHCNLETFLAGQFNDEIRKTMGEAILKDITSKVQHFVEIKNQKTASPLKTQ